VCDGAEQGVTVHNSVQNGENVPINQGITHQPGNNHPIPGITRRCQGSTIGCRKVKTIGDLRGVWGES